ncbi:MAG TPA: hypothetical protein VG895_01715 [Patescibacteria group bacterium]|nr:hypothetical protein [Patescibacteria group bacterium]
MKFFNKTESIVVIIILSVIFVLSYFNFGVANARGRDNERENDLSDISKMLESYKDTNSIYPPSLSGLPNAPKDPGTPLGYSYSYFTDGKFYQLYASLERTDEAEYNQTIHNLSLKCGNFICNYGISASNVPLDKTLQEYENELDAKNKTH